MVVAVVAVGVSTGVAQEIGVRDHFFISFFFSFSLSGWRCSVTQRLSKVKCQMPNSVKLSKVKRREKAKKLSNAAAGAAAAYKQRESSAGC